MVAGAASPRVPELQVKYFNFITNIFSDLAKRTKNKVPHANQMGKYNKSNLNMILSSQTQSRRSRISHLEVSVEGGRKEGGGRLLLVLFVSVPIFIQLWHQSISTTSKKRSRL